MAIIQPENKTLIVNNGNGNPLDFSAAKDIVRSNATQPSNGNVIYEFVSSTKVSANGSSPETVTTDGSTYNNDIGGKGVDIVFKSNRKTGDGCQVLVQDDVDGSDTYLRNGPIDRNFGTCTTIEFGNSRVGSGAKRSLIKFVLPDESNKLSWINSTILDSTVFFYGSNFSGSTSRNYRFYEILPPNGDWIEGTACDAGVSDASPTWRRKSESPIVVWAAAGGCSESGVDYLGTHLFSGDVASSSDAWVEFSQNSSLLNSFINRLLLSSGSNSGFVGETTETTDRFICFSSEYTTDITLRPKMIFLYEQETSGLDESHESPRADMKISNDEINDDFDRDLIGGQ